DPGKRELRQCHCHRLRFLLQGPDNLQIAVKTISVKMTVGRPCPAIGVLESVARPILAGQDTLPQAAVRQKGETVSSEPPYSHFGAAFYQAVRHRHCSQPGKSSGVERSIRHVISDAIGADQPARAKVLEFLERGLEWRRTVPVVDLV